MSELLAFKARAEKILERTAVLDKAIVSPKARRISHLSMSHTFSTVNVHFTHFLNPNTQISNAPISTFQLSPLLKPISLFYLNGLPEIPATDISLRSTLMRAGPLRR